MDGFKRYLDTQFTFTALPAKNDSGIMFVYNYSVKNNEYTSPELMLIDRSLVYYSHTQDKINTQVIYRLQVSDNCVNKT